MKSAIIIFAVVVVVEALVEYGTTIFEMAEKKEYKKAAKQLCAIAVCIFFCFQCNADIFAYCGLTFAIPWLGVALTGVFGSRGSNYVSDLVKRIQSATAATGAHTTTILPAADQTDARKPDGAQDAETAPAGAMWFG